MMMQYGRRAGRMPVQGNLQLDYSPLLCTTTYRDSIRRVSVSGGLWGWGFFPASCHDSDYCWSSASSSGSSPALDACSHCSPLSSSFSSSSDWETADPDAVLELRAIAQRMVRDGYTQGLIRAFGADGRRGLEDSLLANWFLELDVSWVLRIGDGEQQQLHLHLEDGCASLLDMMERWIKALKTMVEVLCITQQELRAKRPPAAAAGVRKAIWYAVAVLLATGKMTRREREQEAAQFVRFAEASVLRMLDFVDAVADAVRNDDDDHSPPDETLPGLLQVYAWVADDSPAVLAVFEEASMTASSSMFDAMSSVFRRKMSRLGDAIWSVMEKVRASFFVTDDDCWGFSSSDEVISGGVHKTTRLMMNYVMLLSRNERALNLILQDKHHHLSHQSQPDHYSGSSVDIVIKDLISCLEKQLEKTSNFISEPGLRYIFLMNNCSFISQKVSSLLLPSWTLFEDYRIDSRPKKRDCRGRPPPMDDYVNHPDPNLQEQIEMDSNLDGLIKTQSFIEAYLDASWEPVISCLYLDIDIPRGRGLLNLVGRLDKFEDQFRKTYAKQKQWKVPNPELRKRLRKAVIEKVIPAYSKYLADRTAKGKRNRPPKNTPLALEELLEELFEG